MKKTLEEIVAELGGEVISFDPAAKYVIVFNSFISKKCIANFMEWLGKEGVSCCVLYSSSPVSPSEMIAKVDLR